MATKTTRREERRLTNILMSEFAVYNCTGNYRQALATLNDVMGVTTDAHLIAEITPTIEGNFSRPAKIICKFEIST